MSSNLNILYIDDNKFDRTLVREALKTDQSKFNLTEVSTFGDFKSILQSDSFDLILSDFNIAGFEGTKVIDAAKEIDSQIPVIIVTGTGTEEFAVEAMKRGAADYVIKTTDHIKKLPSTITNVLEKSRLKQEKQKAEQGLLESERRYSLATAAANVGVWDWDMESKKFYVESNLKRLLGFDENQIDDQISTWKKLLVEEERAEIKSRLYDHIKGVTEKFELEHRLKTADGNSRWFLTRATAFRNSQGVVNRLVGTSTEISEKKKLEEMLFQAQKMEAIGRLAGGVAHDFNNMLAVIRGYSQLMLSDFSREHKFYSYLKQVDGACERAENLTRQLLIFSRNHIVKTQNLKINAIIENLEKMMLRLIGEDIRIVLDLNPEIELIHADSSHIEQVILNIVLNARDAMPSGGEIRIATRNETILQQENCTGGAMPNGRYVKIEIRDNGTGISKEDVEHIFEPFYTTKEFGKATGLGLATVYGIVKQLNGEVCIESEKDKGTCFHIYFPSADKKMMQEEEMPDSATNLYGSESILIVEDEVMVLNVIKDFIEKYGYSVHGCSSAEDAVNLCKSASKKFDLLITDIIMPGLHGPELAKRLLADCPEMKVLYMSGYIGNNSLLAEELAKKPNFIQKPFKPETAARKIRFVLDLPFELAH